MLRHGGDGWLPVNYALINQSCMVALLCIGFSFTLNMEKFPNFAHLTFANWGAVFTFTLVAYLGFSPYIAVPVATLLSGLLGIVLYLLVVRPLRQHGGYRDITLTIAFLGVTWVLRTLALIFSYWTNVAMRVSSRGFRVGGLDFALYEVPGAVVVGLIASVLLVAAMYLFLHRHKQGISIRAVSEDEGLAASVGIDTLRTHMLTWLLVGSLAGFAGAMMSLGGGGAADTDQMFAIVMAGSFIGGVSSVLGAALGGFTIMFLMNNLPSMVLKWAGTYTLNILGTNYDLYRLNALIPYLILYAILMYEPEGIMGIVRRARLFAEKMRDRKKRA
jgi:branched-subunit amino acid ABC-type transport system permease component